MDKGAGQTALQDYLFDLQGYLLLEDAVSQEDVQAMNGWADAHWDYVDGKRRRGASDDSGEWIGHIETHTYGGNDGANFQNIVEAGSAFEKLIDHPSWIELAKRYINSETNGISIHENFLTVRGPGGFINIHCGGHAPLFYLSFRQANTGAWMVGQINVLVALTDIGPGDGPTTLVPGSHKSAETHPRLMVDGKGRVSHGKEPAGTAVGMKEMYMKTGDALFFADAISHGSAERTNEGFRRTVVYRYSPRLVRTRFNYTHSTALIERLTPERRMILDPMPPRRPPE